MFVMAKAKRSYILYHIQLLEDTKNICFLAFFCPLMIVHPS